jgi:hypothetical protein
MRARLLPSRKIRDAVLLALMLSIAAGAIGYIVVLVNTGRISLMAVVFFAFLMLIQLVHVLRIRPWMENPAGEKEDSLPGALPLLLVAILVLAYRLPMGFAGLFPGVVLLALWVLIGALPWLLRKRFIGHEPMWGLRCPRCRYDLRINKGRCPECGAPCVASTGRFAQSSIQLPRR